MLNATSFVLNVIRKTWKGTCVTEVESTLGNTNIDLTLFRSLDLNDKCGFWSYILCWWSQETQLARKSPWTIVFMTTIPLGSSIIKRDKNKRNRRKNGIKQLLETIKECRLRSPNSTQRSPCKQAVMLEKFIFQKMYIRSLPVWDKIYNLKWCQLTAIAFSCYM